MNNLEIWKPTFLLIGLIAILPGLCAWAIIGWRSFLAYREKRRIQFKSRLRISVGGIVLGRGR